MATKAALKQAAKKRGEQFVRRAEEAQAAIDKTLTATAATIDDAVKNMAAAAAVRTHELKSWPSQFAATVAGLKPFEIRRDDRGFLAGDHIRLREWMPVGGDASEGVYTGREVRLVVKRIDSFFGLRDGCVAMTVVPA